MGVKWVRAREVFRGEERRGGRKEWRERGGGWDGEGGEVDAVFWL